MELEKKLCNVYAKVSIKVVLHNGEEVGFIQAALFVPNQRLLSREGRTVYMVYSEI